MNNKQLSKKRVIFAIILVFVLIALFFGASYLKSVPDYQKKVQEIVFHEVDPASIPDGSYIGECDTDFVYAKVQVTIKDGKIVSMDLLEHRQGRGKAAESIIDRIIAKQSIDVDTVSGATNSSKVIKKAVENALIGN